MVSKKEVLEFCKAEGVDCMWISSKEDKSVNEMFYLLAEKIMQRIGGKALLESVKTKTAASPVKTTRECATM